MIYVVKFSDLPRYFRLWPYFISIFTEQELIDSAEHSAEHGYGKLEAMWECDSLEDAEEWAGHLRAMYNGRYLQPGQYIKQLKSNKEE